MSLEVAAEYVLSEEADHSEATIEQDLSPRDEPMGNLTKREGEVMVLVARGLTNRQISRELGISERTAGNHIAKILKKLGLRSHPDRRLGVRIPVTYVSPRLGPLTPSMFPKRGITELMDENDFFLWDVLGVSGVRFPLTCLDVAFVRRSKKCPVRGRDEIRRFDASCRTSPTSRVVLERASKVLGPENLGLLERICSPSPGDRLDSGPAATFPPRFAWLSLSAGTNHLVHDQATSFAAERC